MMQKTHKRTFKKALLLSTAFVFVLLGTLSFPLSSKVDAAALRLIPAGCPDSPLPGPRNAATCSAIPLGCPGSTQQGPPSAAFKINDCPYTKALDTCPDGTTAVPSHVDQGEAADWCKTAGEPGNLPATVKSDCNDRQLTAANCGIVRYLVLFINTLSALVGVVVVAMIILGGIQYSAAGDNPQMVGAAKKRIFNAVLALVIFIFMFTFLQWLIPGGIFTTSPVSRSLIINRHNA